jgi:SAM-dependent methyltransferase
LAKAIDSPLSNAFDIIMRKLLSHRVRRRIPVPEYLRARVERRMDIQRAFYAGLLLRNGVRKTTDAHRVDDLFPLLVKRAAPIDQRPLRVLDVGCSAGVTTVEIHQFLVDCGISCETYGTDLLLYADHVASEDNVAILFDRDRNVLQIEIGSWASPWKFRKQDLLLRPHLCFLASQVAKNQVVRFRMALDTPCQGLRVTRVPLLASVVDSQPDVQFKEEDILEPMIQGTFGVIWAVNLLNLGYFAPDDIRSMVRVLTRRLFPGGLLIVSRTEPPGNTNHATLFRYCDGKLVAEEHLNRGSEIEDIVLSADCS